MKNLISILLATLVLISCNKEKVDQPVTPPRVFPQYPAINVMTNCNGYFKIDSNNARRPQPRGPQYSLTATPISATFDGKATVRLSFKVKGKPIKISRRKEGEPFAVNLYSCQSCSQYTDANAQASTTYYYIVNDLVVKVRTKDAPIVGGSEQAPVYYLAFEGGVPKGWGTWVSYVGGAGFTEAEKDSIVNVKQRELSDKHSLGIIVTRDSNVYNSTHYTRRQRVFYTEDNEWFGNQAGGVAYLNSFGKELDAFVFTRLLYYRADYCAFAGGHEGGHGLGLPHAVDSVGQSYSVLTPNWMGAGYHFDNSLRFLGESVLSNTQQGYVYINQILIARNTLGL